MILVFLLENRAEANYKYQDFFLKEGFRTEELNTPKRLVY